MIFFIHQELANENRLLKALQKRQDSALRKYEGKNAELPRIINSHHEELKVLQTKYKKLRLQHKQTSDLLKEKETEIYSLQVNFFFHFSTNISIFFLYCFLNFFQLLCSGAK